MRKLLILSGIFAIIACNKEPKSEVIAHFETDQDQYSIFDQITITNTSSAENAQIATYEWDFGDAGTSYKETPDPISYEEVGEYVISLKVTSDVGSLTSTYQKTITVIDDNIKPVANFSYSPQEISSGSPVTFTDESTDEDGSIEAWEWTFGTTVIAEQNPTYTFTSYGDIEVSLKVTDDKMGTSTKKITINVAKGPGSLEVLWKESYSDKTDAYVYATSPAVSKDGKFIYVSSTGYELTCFNTDGEKQWAFDLASRGASAMGNDGNIKHQSPTPSVDEDGTVYIPANFDEPCKATGGVFAITGGASGGSEKWYADYGAKTSFRYLSPVITDKYIMTTQRNTSNFNKQNFVVLSKSDGSEVFNGHVNAGSYGGIIATKDGKVLAGTGGGHATRLFFPDGEGKWKFSRTTASDREHNLGTYFNGTTYKWDTPNGSQPAISKDGKIYQVFKASSGAVSTGAALYCYDNSKLEYGTFPEPEWICAINGDVPQSGLGVVIGEDGTAYVTTADKEGAEARLSAVGTDGSVKWELIADGNINGLAAIDDQGYIYFNDYSTGKLIKVSSTGEKVAEIKLGTSLRSSPTISKDGTIYITGLNEDNKPTIFAVAGAADGHADSWSQLGGNPSKTSYMY